MKNLIKISLILVILLVGCSNTTTVDIVKENYKTEIVFVDDNSAIDEIIEPTSNDSHSDIIEYKSSEILESEEKAEIEAETVEVFSKVNWPVKFESQAPHTNWELPYQEACEEAALILVEKYFTDDNLDADIMDQEIKDLVDWQNETWGFYTDISLNEAKLIADVYFGLNTVISEQVTVDYMKYQLAEGNLIIVPTYGRVLGNENYTGDGPIYHFLVIRGYDSNQFITNDVGTRNGENYKYKYNTLINAVHDLPIDEEGEPIRLYDEEMIDDEKVELIQKGQKKMLIITGFAQ